MRCASIYEWSGIWHIFAAAQALKINIKQVHPLVKTNPDSSMYQFLNSLISCIRNDDQGLINIMWSNVTNNVLNSNWRPNHFICLLPISKDFLNRECDLEIDQELNQSFENLNLENM